MKVAEHKQILLTGGTKKEVWFKNFTFDQDDLEIIVRTVCEDEEWDYESDCEEIYERYEPKDFIEALKRYIELEKAGYNGNVEFEIRTKDRSKAYVIFMWSGRRLIVWSGINMDELAGDFGKKIAEIKRILGCW